MRAMIPLSNDSADESVWRLCPCGRFHCGTLQRVAMPSANGPSEELFLVAIVEMAPGHAAAGQRYEDAVLELLNRHGGSVERRMRSTDSATEVHLIRFGSRAGYESFMVDPDRLWYRNRLGDAVPATRVLEVRDL